MIGLEAILNRLTILLVFLDKEGKASLRLAEVIRKKGRLEVNSDDKDIERMDKEKIKEPVLLFITGYGIIRKAFRKEEDAGRIIYNDGLIRECRESREGEYLYTFTRKDKVGWILDQLEQYRIPVMDIFLSREDEETLLSREDDESLQQALSLVAARYYAKGIKWRELFEVEQRGNLLSEWVLKKIKLPALLFLMFLMLVNYFWYDKVRENYSRQQTELSLSENSYADRNKLSSEMQRMLEEYRESRKDNTAFVLDRIASRVPEELMLECLVVDPVLKGMEEKKPLLIRSGYVEMTGTTLAPDKVTFFTGRLSEPDFVKEVKLISLNKQRESGRFNFKIWIRL